MDPKKEDSSIDKFFEALPQEDKELVDILDDKKPEESKVEEPKAEEPKVQDEPRKNRRHRRLEEQLQAERESNIALNERIKVLAEVDKAAHRESDEMPGEWIALYGDTPESKKAWAYQQSLLEKYTEQAEERALARIREEQQQALQEQQEYEHLIDSELESLEDQFDVDLTSNAPAARKARTEFLSMIEKFSPKDESGNIISYADFESTFEAYQEMRSKEKANPIVEKQKEMASRSMQSGSNAGSETQKITPGFTGWKQDYNL